jgi:hypothetical protein
MQQLLITIAAVVLVGCGASEPPEPPDISTHDAAKKGNPEDVKLHDAAEKGNLEAVKQHLAAGANVNAKDDDGWTPLHSAAFKGHKKIAELLIAKGASVNAKGYMEQTPLDVATHPDNPNDIAETTLLLRKNGGKTGKPAINLLQQMGDIELKDEALDISVYEAAEDGNIEDLTVIMRVNPTSSDVVGHTRTETGVGDISNLYFYSSGAFSFDEIRIGKTYESVTSKELITSNNIIFYEGFDYVPAAQLTNQDEWYKGGRISRRSDNYTIRKGSLTYSDISSSGNRAYAKSSEVMSGIGRRIPKNLLENNKGKIFVSFLLQPEVKLHEGIYEGYFVLSLGTNKGKEINFGKGGESKIATKEHYVSELEGGFKRVSSGVKCEIEKTALIVLEINSRWQLNQSASPLER